MLISISKSQYIFAILLLAFSVGVRHANAITASATCTTPKAAHSATVSFEGNASDLPCGKTIDDVTWYWDFGDGGSSSDPLETTHSYTKANAGVKTVTLTVSCSGESDDDTCTVYVVADVIIDTIASRPDDKISFNKASGVKGHLLPSSIQSQIGAKIDWEMNHVFRADCRLINVGDNETTLTWTTNWPTSNSGNWPASNSGWGSGDALIASIDKWTGAYDQTNDLNTVGYLQASVSVSKFFDVAGTENPGTGNPPNWYYYWSMTPGSYGTHYLGTFSQTHYVSGEWVACVGSDCSGEYLVLSGPLGGETLDGIDTFAWVTRHEGCHVEDFGTWWPNGPSGRSGDGEGDFLPDAQEGTLGGTVQNPINGGPFNPKKEDTNDNQVGDADDYCHNTQDPWTPGDGHDYDWACPGQQW